MKISAMLPHLELFGGVRRYLEIGNEFVKRGHQFTIYHSDGSLVKWFKFLGEVKPIDFVLEEKNDIAICGEYSIVDLLSKTKAKKKIFYLILEGHTKEKEICTKKGFILLGNSTSICERVERKYKVKCIRAIGGINPEMFFPQNVIKDDQKIEILCSGRIYKRRKGIKKVIKAVEILYRKYPFIHLSMFDTPVGNPLPDPQKLVHPEVPFNFYLDLPQEEMSTLYSRADIFVSAERRAGWCNPAAEAMACKVAVVCTKSGTGDFAFNGETALLVSILHPYFIAREIKKLIKDENLRRKLAENGYRKIQEFTWTKLVDKLEKIFFQLLA